MALPAPTYDGILKSLKARNYAPVYLLHGEEGYFIDAIAKAFEDVLPDDEKAFNQYVLYAPEVEPAQIIDLCRRIPMMSDKQVIILKEAQAVRADRLAKLAPYIADPVPSTILVICCRGAQAKGKELMAACRKSEAVVFESKKIQEYNIPAYITQYVKQKGLGADAKAVEMLRDFIGADLSKLYNELDKLASLLPPNATITPEVVERNIGVSREYNSFELVDALAEKNALKAFRCLAYFKSNPKAVPLVMAAASVFNYFADLLVAYYAPGRTDSAIMEALKLRNTFQLRRIRQGMASYSAVQVVEIISAIRSFDAASKGVGSRQNEHQLFHDLIFHILTAPGKL
ncbi:MAG: DNA polymerase III subunit delta [Muribaculaceae bacterium]|nr:DNA polymerase III subunit delta [Muribaculaceae bacterium]